MVLKLSPELVDKTGVYVIENWVNGKKYIGSAAVSFRKRWYSHTKALRRGNHRNKYLQNSWNKYGEDNFVFDILEVVEPEDCVAAEQRWIDGACPEFNAARVAGSLLGFKHKPESKQRIGEAHKRYYETPGVREKMRAEWHRRIAADPTLRSRMVEGIRRRSSEPEVREAHRRWWVENPTYTEENRWRSRSASPVTPQIFREIATLLSEGVNMTAIHRKLSIGKDTLRAIKRGVHWTCEAYPPQGEL